MTTAKLDFSKALITGAKDVFSTMLMVDLVDKKVIVNQRMAIDSNLTSMLGLGGGLRGVLAIHCPAVTAQRITGIFLDMEIDDLNEDVKDAIGEIANMVAGNLKVACAEQNINIELAIPTSIVGHAFAVSGMAEASRVIVPFVMEDEPFWIELMYVLNS